MQDKKLKLEIPEIVLLPDYDPEKGAPVILDAYSRTGYSDGQARRRARRKKQRQNKKR